MKRIAFLLTVLALLVTATAAVALAQTNLVASMLNPLIVTIEEEVPVEVTVATALGDGVVVTSTVPITVGVSLAVTIAGDGVVTMEAGEAVGAGVEVEAIPAGEEMIDNSGLSYTLEIADHLELVQLTTTEDSLDDLDIIGEIRNLDDDPVERIRITITLYDHDGNMLDVHNGSMANSEIAPGMSGPFTTYISTDFDDVGSYRIQIE